MGGRTDVARRSRGTLARRAATAALLIALAACSSDDPEPGSGAQSSQSIGTSAPVTTEDDLGTRNPASGDPVKIGQVTEGTTPTLETTDEIRAGQATVDYLNDYRGGIGGRPIQLVTCEMKATPATATECANRMVEEDVVAVTLPQSAVTESLWGPLHDEGIPLIVLSGFGEALLEDEQSTFIMVNPVATLFGLPISLAEAEGADKVAFVVIDVPQAVDIFDADDGAPHILEGLDRVVCVGNDHNRGFAIGGVLS